jgi:isoleucyl-tRNA synthetase
MSNLFDFDHDQDLINPDNYTELDKWIVLKAKDLQEEIKQDYENYEIHLAFQKVLNFCTNELGGFYLDIIKDRLYTSKQNGNARRAAQSAIYQLLNALITWIAPILSYTAEEAFIEINKNNSSVFLEEWFSNWADISKTIDDETWNLLIEIKIEVNKLLEEKRNNGEIGSSLEAEVTLHCDDQLFINLSEISTELKFLFITSKANLIHLDGDKTNTEIEGLKITINQMKAKKCDRCWHYVEELIDYKEEKICNRCKENIEGKGEVRFYI